MALPINPRQVSGFSLGLLIAKVMCEQGVFSVNKEQLGVIHFFSS